MPEFQNREIGSSLIVEGLKRARELVERGLNNIKGTVIYPKEFFE